MPNVIVVNRPLAELAHEEPTRRPHGMLRVFKVVALGLLVLMLSPYLLGPGLLWAGERLMALKGLAASFWWLAWQANAVMGLVATFFFAALVLPLNPRAQPLSGGALVLAGTALLAWLLLFWASPTVPGLLGVVQSTANGTEPLVASAPGWLLSMVRGAVLLVGAVLPPVTLVIVALSQC